MRTRWQPYSSKPLALSETKFPPPHRSGPSASSSSGNSNSAETITPAHLIDEAINKLEQYERHAKPALDRYYAVRQKAAAAAAAQPAQSELVSPGAAGIGIAATSGGLGKGGREEAVPVQKNELDISRDPRLRR